MFIGLWIKMSARQAQRRIRENSGSEGDILE